VFAVDNDAKALARNPHPSAQADSLEYFAEHGHEFDAVHGSPVCKRYSDLSALHQDVDYPDEIPAFRAAFIASGLPYVIENVEGAPLMDPLWLCGTEFGLSVVTRDGSRRWLQRHRGFESNVHLWGAGGCSCSEVPIVGVYGTGGGGQMTRGYKAHPEEARDVMGMPWASRRGVSQAIPPAYTEFIGAQLLDALRAAA
jgi:DNA (cytosine-5)-methyltransferase 1